MGVSTDAILFYGFCWDEETSTPWTIGKDDDEEDPDEDDWEIRYARLKGVVRANEKYPDKGIDPKTGRYRTDYTPEEQAIVDRYSAFLDAKGKVVDASGCEVDTHCCQEAPMPYVFIKTSKITNWRGSMTPITMDTLKVGDDWDQQLAAFCDLMGINVKDKKPGWFLVSYWG